MGCAALVVLVMRSPEEAMPPRSPLEANLASLELTLPLGPGATVARADVEEGQLVHMLIDDGDARVRVRATHGLDAKTAQERIEQDRQRISALFGERQAPYPGELSNSLKCPDRFKPTDHEPKGSARTMVRLFANERLAFGGCSEDLLAYAATLGTWYDPGAQRLVQVTYYSPRSAMVDAGPELLVSAQLGSAP